MRQIHVCAWLLLTSLAAAACSGEKFTASEQDSGGNETPAETSAGTPSRNHAGSSSAGGTVLGSGGHSLSTGGGSASGGSAQTSGGASSAGRSSLDDAAGAASEDCPSGAVTFRMLPGPD